MFFGGKISICSRKFKNSLYSTTLAHTVDLWPKEQYKLLLIKVGEATYHHVIMFHFNAVFHRAISQTIIKLCTWLKGLIWHISCSCFGFPSGKTQTVQVAPRAANRRALLSVAWDIFSREGGSTEGSQVRGATAVISLLCSLRKGQAGQDPRELLKSEVRGWVFPLCLLSVTENRWGCRRKSLCSIHCCTQLQRQPELI